MKKINLKKFFVKVKDVCFTKKERQHSERYYRIIGILNKYSILFHALLACAIVFFVELLSRRSIVSTASFFGGHTMAFFYNAFIVFVSLSLVYLFRRRAFVRIIITGFWTILGIINGCVLSNRVTPFGYTDLKCIPDLLAMNNTNYFTAEEATLVVIGLSIFLFGCVVLFIKGPRYEGKIRYIPVVVVIVALLFGAIPLATNAAQSTNVVASYFANIAQGYSDYGFIYSFSSSVVGRGMSKPSDYSEDKIEEIMKDVKEASTETTVDATTAPNVICVLLESFCDPEEIKTFECEEDPIPTFHQLEQNYSTGYLTVPVVGAGTANSEFEVLSGMSMQYFGTGEYPYKTILKKTDCEAIGSVLSSVGYQTHAVHNNGGNFYSRVNAFSQMGFDTFTSKELMDIKDYTPNGNWPTDDILVSETIKTLDATPDQPDFTYTITVGTHGDYQMSEEYEPFTKLTGIEDEEMAAQWTYYINQLHEGDRFIANLISALSQRDEKTIVVFFGDHLPTMGLEDADMKSGNIYKTKYITWNNFGLEKQDQDLYAYQLLANTLDQIGIHEGTIFRYHQTQMESKDYAAGLEALQYDILYGNRYCYNGMDKKNPYPAKEIVMGIDDVVISDTYDAYNGEIYINGKNFTRWSKVYINGEKVSTTFYPGYFGGSNSLCISKDDVKDGDIITVVQLGSSNTEFRTSNEFVYDDPDIPNKDTETTESTETSQTTETEKQE